MTYTLNEELPQHIKLYSEKVQSQWRHVYNTVYKSTKVKDRAVKAANSILKKRMSGRNSLDNNSRHDIFQTSVNRYLGKLNG